jgi:hypothetical protein
MSLTVHVRRRTVTRSPILVCGIFIVASVDDVHKLRGSGVLSVKWQGTWVLSSSAEALQGKSRSCAPQVSDHMLGGRETGMSAMFGSPVCPWMVGMSLMPEASGMLGERCEATRPAAGGGIERYATSIENRWMPTPSACGSGSSTEGRALSDREPFRR